MIERKQIVKGLFYPISKELMQKKLTDFDKLASEIKSDNDCVIAPHAGYVFSGLTALKAIKSLKQKKLVVIIGVNHTGQGKSIGIWPNGFFESTFGAIEIAENETKKLIETKLFEPDYYSQVQEHSIEVMLPILQFYNKDFKIISICLSYNDIETSKKIAQTLFEFSKENDFALIASSDFTHYEPENIAKEKDLSLIKEILKLNLENFEKKRIELNASVCGFTPIQVLIEYCKLKKMKANLIEYTSSARASHDPSSVVGYAALGFKEKTKK